MLVVAPISILILISILSVSIALFYYREAKRLDHELCQFEKYIFRENDLRIKIKHLYRLATFGKLSAGLFHDMTNLFQNILIQIDQIERCEKDLSKVLSHIPRVVTASKCMSKFIQLARKQLRSETVCEQFSVVLEIKDAMQILEYLARESQVKLVFTADVDLYLYGDSIRFHRVFVNLITNAIHALDCVDTHSRVVTIVFRKEKENAIFFVEDNGCGIPAKYISKIFDTFFTTKSMHKGIGLGLSTTREIIQQDFKGTISVKSREGYGSVFMIRIPI